jgi:hypothetical protein
MRNVPKSVLFVTSLAVAGGAVLFGDLWRGAPKEADQTTRPAVGATPARETVGLAELRGLDRSLKADITPSLDIVRIEPGGDAVIAGRSAPGATVELLRDGAILDKTTTDRAGHFVMIPPRLPPGRYELTVVAVQPDGKQVSSKRSIPVTLPPGPVK